MSFRVVPPEKVFENMDVTAFSEKSLDLINELLSDVKYTRDWLYGMPDNPYYEFIVPGEPTEGDRKKITEQILAAGWGRVEIKSSSENNERPGITGIKLFRYKHSTAEQVN